MKHAMFAFTKFCLDKVPVSFSNQVVAVNALTRKVLLARDVEAVIFQPLPRPLPHLALPLPQTKNEKMTVDNF